MGHDTDQTPVAHLDADTELNAPAFDDDPTPPAGVVFDDTAPVIVDRRPITERHGVPPIRAHAPRRAAVHRAVTVVDTAS